MLLDRIKQYVDDNYDKFVKWARAQHVRNYPELATRAQYRNVKLSDAESVCYYLIEFIVNSLNFEIEHVNKLNGEDLYIVVFLRGKRSRRGRSRAESIYQSEHAFFFQSDRVLHAFRGRNAMKLEKKPALGRYLNSRDLKNVARSFRMTSFVFQDSFGADLVSLSQLPKYFNPDDDDALEIFKCTIPEFR
jgi:hypothetical protein